MMKGIQLKNNSAIFNKALYALFVLLAVILIIQKEYSAAMPNLGIALVFDPFNQNIRFSDRPVYQKAWLMVHVIAVLALLVLVWSDVL